MSEVIGYTVWHSRMNGEPTGPSTYGPWEDTDLLIASEVRDPVAPDVAAATMELNLPYLNDFCWNWKNYLNVGDRIAVVSDHATEADREILFCGFLADVDWTFDTSQHVIVTAVGTPFRLKRDADYLIFGRRMLAKNGSDINLYSGLPCVFNEGGRPNRSADACLTIDGAPSGGVYYFTSVTDPDAAYWTITDALEYLMWFYNASQKWLTNYDFTAGDYAAAFTAPPVQMDVEGMGLWAAIAAVADHGGYDLSCRTAIAGETITESIRLIRKGAGAEQVLDHQPPAADGSFDAFDAERTNLFAASVAEATASCVTSPVVAGARPLYEITIECGKAWNSSGLSLPSGARVVMPGDEKANSTNDYVKRYVVGGAEFTDYSEVGRLWDANTDGFFSDAPWSLSVPDVAALAGQTAGSWPVMPYKPLRMLTQLAGGKTAAGLEQYIEYTIDGGSNWYAFGGNQCRVLDGTLGVYITAANLAGIYPDGGSQQTDNLFQKLIDAPASVKVRLTCCVASPHRTYYTPERRPAAGTAFEQSAFFDRSAEGELRVLAASSRFYGGGAAADEADQTARLTEVAAGLQDINEDRFIEAGMTIEWIAPDINLGDRVTRIGGIEVDLRTGSGAATRSPRVVCRTFRLAADTYQTELTLDTQRKQPVL